MMAGTTLTLQPTATSMNTSPNKRKRDIEVDTRQQVCLGCTLAWPWVMFRRNEDGSRNMAERKCFTCLGLDGKQWDLNTLYMNESIASAKRKVLSIDPGRPSSSSTSTTPSGLATSATATATAQATSMIQSSIPIATKGPQNGVIHPRTNQMQVGGSSQAQPLIHPLLQQQQQIQVQRQQHPPSQQQYQTNGFHPDHHLYGMNPLPPVQPNQTNIQYQNQNQPVVGQSYGYKPLPTYHPPQSRPYSQPQPQHAYYQQPTQNPQNPHNDLINLYRQPEPIRSFNWVWMNYTIVQGAIPILQRELFAHYQQSIPHQGFPPLQLGKDFIKSVQKAFDNQGVKLDGTNWTIVGLKRKDHAIMQV